MNKQILADTLGTLLSLSKTSTKNLMSLEKETLQEMYDSYIINAKASNANAFQQYFATRRAETTTEVSRV
jgi:hypothetical protein